MVLTYSGIGSNHVNHNTDALVTEDLTERHVLLAVMDGSGTEPDGHFAATLVARVLRNIARQTNLRTFAERRQPTTGELLRGTMQTLLSDLRRLNADLGLGADELLTTLVLAVVDRQGPRAEIITIGSGVVGCDGEVVEYAHGHQPDFIGHHLNVDFDQWWAGQPRRLVCEDFLDLTLATDGLLSFRPFSPDSYHPVTPDELTEFLVSVRDEGSTDTFYRRHLLYVRDRFGLEYTDDLTIVRWMT